MLLGRLLENTLRREGAALRASLMRTAGDLDLVEDALQEACLRALERWPAAGLPERPAAWLSTVAQRIVLDRFRRPREQPLDDKRAATLRSEAPCPEQATEIAQAPSFAVNDDRLRLLFQVCHPSLAVEASMALALKVIGGLSTREIARAFLLSDTSAAQRLVRAKQKIRQANIPFALPAAADLPARRDAVLQVVYLIFNEGYVATESVALIRPDLCDEAIRLAELVVQWMADDAEAFGLLALLLLTDARRAARTDDEGNLLTLDEQDRSRWDAARIARGQDLLDHAMRHRRRGPYQLQAAIAALHADAADSQATDWRQILALYRRLLQLQPSPVTELNAAIAQGMAEGPEQGLAWLDRLQAEDSLARYHLLQASRAAFLARLDRRDDARQAYSSALSLTRNAAEQRFLRARLASLS